MKWMALKGTSVLIRHNKIIFFSINKDVKLIIKLYENTANKGGHWAPNSGEGDNALWKYTQNIAKKK